MSRLRDLFRKVSESKRRDEAVSEATRPCPHCGQAISRGATVCLHCERDVTAVMQAGQFVQLFGSPDQERAPVESSTDSDSAED